MIGDIRTRIYNTILVPMRNAELLRTIDRRPVDSIGPQPAAWLGDAVAEVQFGHSAVWTWKLPLTVVVSRMSNYEMEQDAVEPLIDTLLSYIRTNYTLAGTTQGLELTEFREGIVKVSEQSYAGFTLTFRIKEKSYQELTG